MDGCSRETLTLLALCARNKRLQSKMTKDYYWIGAEENVDMFSNSCEMNVIALFTCLSLKDKLGLCSIKCHTHTMTWNHSARLQTQSY